MEERAFELVARSRRGELTESWHFGAVAVSDAAGELVSWVGDAQRAAFLRSAAKPMQAVAMLEAGLADERLADRDLALMCASHAGCDLHVERVAELLEESGLAPAALLCGAHEPLDSAAREALRSAGRAPTALHNNCSGKHAGMLRTCRAAEWSLGDYISEQHPLQLRIGATVDRFCQVAGGTLASATDGCGVPTFRAPLSSTARAYACFADPSALPDGRDREFAERIYRAMTGAPDRVAGPGRFSTQLMEVAGGTVLGKEGADGFYALALRRPRPLGVALKIADGTEACRDGVVLEVLRQLGALDEAQLGELESFRVPLRKDCRGRSVGDILPVVQLETP